MAKFSYSGMDALLLSMEEIANIPDETIEGMCSAGADIGKIAVEASVSSHGLVDTGTLQRSFQKRLKKDSTGRPYYAVDPMGTHHVNEGGSRVRNAEVAFIHEFGAPLRGIPATTFMAESVEKSADDVLMAEYKIYDNFLKSHGL